VVSLQASDGLRPVQRRRAAPLFSELLDLAATGRLLVSERGGTVDLTALELRDFHTLRAVAMRLGWLYEEPVHIACRNCDAPIRHTPCAALELGPFIDAELDDPELDRTLDLSEAHPIPAVPVGDGALAHRVTLTQVSVAIAAPLHRALRRRRLRVSEAVVVAMGLTSLGPVREPQKIAEALAAGSDEVWHAIGDLFLRAHYPLRLSSIALCGKCGARNDVDAPYEREFEPTASLAPSNEQLFPAFDAFSDQAQVFFDSAPLRHSPPVTLVVDAGVPACDDGGEPLLGAYVPPGGDPEAAVGRGEITLYFRSFRAIWEEEGPYNWQAELSETIAHELEHHNGWLAGHDPMDDDERAEIARERAVVVGRKHTVRAGLGALGVDLGGFIARTWPIWLIVAVWTIAISVCGVGEN
jgi:hypothetical protein